jgi:hypothetical protein
VRFAASVVALDHEDSGKQLHLVVFGRFLRLFA